MGRLPGGGEDIDTADSRERRRGSGSFLGAEESDEEISFRGSGSLRDRLGETSLVIALQQNSQLTFAGSDGYQRLETSSGPQPCEEEKLKRKLKFFFMNPVEKYYATR